MRVLLATLLISFSLYANAGPYLSPISEPAQVVALLEEAVAAGEFNYPSELEGYEITNLSFDFIRREWWLDYKCADGGLGCGFTAVIKDGAISEMYVIPHI